MCLSNNPLNLQPYSQTYVTVLKLCPVSSPSLNQEACVIKPHTFAAYGSDIVAIRYIRILVYVISVQRNYNKINKFFLLKFSMEMILNCFLDLLPSYHSYYSRLILFQWLGIFLQFREFNRDLPITCSSVR